MKNGVYLLSFNVNNINLFQDRVLFSVFEKKTSKEENDLVQLILKDIDKSIKNPKNIELISVNDDYDIYKFQFNNKLFCLKTSFDPECEYLKNEEKNLKKINTLISPILLKAQKTKIGDDLYCLMTTFENADSIYKIGAPIVYEEFDSFCHAYSLLQNSKPIPFNYKHNISSFLKNNDLNSIGEDKLNDIKEYTDLDKIQKIFKSLHNDLKTIKHSVFAEKKFICHGDLNEKNILYRNGFFKFINFGNAYSSHCFLDLADLVINLSFDQKIEIDVLNSFCKNLNLDFNENKNIYLICYEIAIRKKLLNIMFSYLKEVYVLKSMRTEKLIDISKDFSNNYQRFLKIDYFYKNKEFLFKTITEPILHEKA